MEAAPDGAAPAAALAELSLAGEEDLTFGNSASAGASDPAADRFDSIVGALEDAMMDEGFRERQDAYCRSNCGVFDDAEEMKLEYTPIFEAYVAMVEGYIEEALGAAVEGFSMEEFMGLIAEHEAELEGSDIFDLLYSLAKFGDFKDLMLSYKAEEEGGVGAALGGLTLSVTVFAEPAGGGDGGGADTGL